MAGHGHVAQSRESYPLFVPPHGLADQRPADWSLGQAKQYLAWLEFVLPDRVSFLVRYFGLGSAWDEATLSSLQGLLSTELLDLPFSDETGAERTLTSSGYAVAADMGLLVADLLLRTGLTSWEILRRPKRDVNYHQPVLNGLRGHAPFNPIWAALKPAHRIVSGKRLEGGWVLIYESARDLLGA